MNQDIMSISRYCRIRGLSLNKLLNVLGDLRIIPKTSQRKVKPFTVHTKDHTIISDGKTIRIDTDKMDSYIDLQCLQKKVRFVDEDSDILDSIIDSKVRLKRILEASKGTIAFVDAEYRDGNFYEFALDIVKNGVSVEKRYFIVREDYIRRRRKNTVDNKIERLKENGIPFELVPMKHIKRYLKKTFRNVDYIVSHNAYAERHALIKNGMFHTKKKFICTAKMSKGLIQKQTDPSLMELNGLMKCPFNSNFAHYAFEDVKMTKAVFFKMLQLHA